ncbi:hypothetical protein [Pseudonocardia sp. HH130630-07]|uniref:hypothetical protein n=1 Tax=Pseudonocardia sp. HH130630-07 TaxID=1690815 RepID=UPI0008150548|nr:hypothetical protein [Pseudonocardia sp. HH130630-07]ANY06839.1 hypothetical protein AFB00_11655 [Pseudonocardia sp. HH130630-07]
MRDVVGHLSIASNPPRAALLYEVVRARGSYDRAMDRMSRAAAAAPVPGLVATIRANADSRFAVAGVGPRGPLTDVLVHSVDVTVPLGAGFEADPAAVGTALGFVTGRRAAAFVRRGRLDGLRLVAAERPDTGYGDGTEVRGPGTDLLAAACGRAAVLDRLDGPGLPALAARLVPAPGDPAR